MSHLFASLASGDVLACKYTVNIHDYTMGYYLADNIYPPCSTFVKTISELKNQMEAEFAKAHELGQKDSERVFSVLQARFQ
jgi:hypothetical protein